MRYCDNSMLAVVGDSKKEVGFVPGGIDDGMTHAFKRFALAAFRGTAKFVGSMKKEKHSPCTVIGIAGGSGSGKTFLARKLAEALGEEACHVLALDTYYKDFSHLPRAARDAMNWDHPDACDQAGAVADVQAFVAEQGIRVRHYDFAHHRPHLGDARIEKKSCLIVEGLLTWHFPALKALLDYTVFVSTSADVRLARRILRDVEEQGRTPASVVTQYLDTVRPMHDQYIEPQQESCDLVLSGEAITAAQIDLILKAIHMQD